jgi:hypothetical protein
VYFEPADQLREYLYRFRTVLSIPERLLFAVDDFDRPLTESNIRLFAGAMLDMLKAEFDGDDLHDTLFRMREELRYYADVMRFASICYQLSEPLQLGIEQEKKRPTAERVISLLCALAERTLSTPLIRADLDSAPSRQDDAVKTEKQRWDQEKKALSAASLQAKGAEAKRLADEVSKYRVSLIRFEPNTKTTSKPSPQLRPTCMRLLPGILHDTVHSWSITTGGSTMSSAFVQSTAHRSAGLRVSWSGAKARMARIGIILAGPPTWRSSSSGFVTRGIGSTRSSQW